MPWPDAPSASRAGNLFAALTGFVLGNALQMQQAALWDGPAYAASGMAGLLACAISGGRRAGPVARCSLMLVALALLGFSTTGLRSCYFDLSRLNPMLEGRDVQITNVRVKPLASAMGI